MENNNQGNIEEDSLFTKIDPNLKNRMTIYIANSKLVNQEKTDTQRKLVEEALHEYMVNNPILVNA